MAEKPEQIILTNEELTSLLKRNYNKQGNYQLVVNFGLGAATMMDKSGKPLPSAIAQVVGVGIEKVQ